MNSHETPFDPMTICPHCNGSGCSDCTPDGIPDQLAIAKRKTAKPSTATHLGGIWKSHQRQQRASVKEAQRQLRLGNKLFPNTLVEIPPTDWPDVPAAMAAPPEGPERIRVLRSNQYLVQVFRYPGGNIQRLSICRTQIDGWGRWLDGITWDDLQALKRQAGFGDYDAVEVFPADDDMVCIANMRHLWVMVDPLPFAWRRDKTPKIAIRLPENAQEP